MAAYQAKGIQSTEAMNEDQLRIYECAVVDTALRSGNIAPVTADMVQRVQKAYTDMKLPRYAEIVARLLQDGQLTTDAYVIQAAHHNYIEQPPPAPRMQMASFILEHPELFSASTRK